jgi:hypothetical protein
MQICVEKGSGVRGGGEGGKGPTAVSASGKPFQPRAITKHGPAAPDRPTAYRAVGSPQPRPQCHRGW